MNDVSYTVLKLTNGEDIICEVDYERYDSEASPTQRVFEIQNPCFTVNEWFCQLSVGHYLYKCQIVFIKYINNIARTFKRFRKC